MGDMGSSRRGPDGLRLADPALHRSRGGIFVRAGRADPLCRPMPSRSIFRASGCRIIAGTAPFTRCCAPSSWTTRHLQRIARMVDEADVVQEVALEPAAPGLDLICRGLRLTSPDDQVALERGALIYDALYAQL